MCQILVISPHCLVAVFWLYFGKALPFQAGGLGGAYRLDMNVWPDISAA